MVDLNKVIKQIDQRIRNLKKKVEKRRPAMADQDTPNVSRYITATRWAVEQEIESMDHELVRLEQGKRELSQLGKYKSRYNGNYFVTDNFEFLDLGIISRKTPLGQQILNKYKNQ